MIERVFDAGVPCESLDSGWVWLWLSLTALVQLRQTVLLMREALSVYRSVRLRRLDRKRRM